MIFRSIATAITFSILLSGCSNTTEPKPTAGKAKGTLVYARVDLPENAKIDLKDFEERKVNDENLPSDAVQEISELKGRELKYNVAKGQLISKYDLK